MKILIPLGLLATKAIAEFIPADAMVTVFHDDFDGEVSGSDTNHVLRYWKYNKGATDLCGGDTIYPNEHCVHGKCIDLDGSVSTTLPDSSVDMESINSFYADGVRTCKLSYSLAGSGRDDGDNTALVSVKENNTKVVLSTGTVTKHRLDGYTTYEQTFDVPASTSFKLSIVHKTPHDNRGLLLDDVDLKCTSGKDYELFEVFNEDFEEESSTTSGTNYALKKWELQGGTTIDLVGPVTTPYPNFKCAEGSGKCIDLDGTTNKAVNMRTKEKFTSTCPRVCKLSYSLSGNQRGSGEDQVTISVVGSKTLSTLTTKSSWNDPFQEYNQIFQAGANEAFRINVAEEGGDNVGQIFDSVSLCCSRPTYHLIYNENFESGVESRWSKPPKTADHKQNKKRMKISKDEITSTAVLMSSKERCCKLSYDLKGELDKLDKAPVVVETKIGGIQLSSTAANVATAGDDGWSRYEDEFSVAAGKEFRVKVNGKDNCEVSITNIEIGCTVVDDSPNAALSAQPVEEFSGYDVLFRENFENEDDSATSTNFDHLSQWDIARGYIDVVGPKSKDYTGFGCNQGSGKCIDLDGSKSAAGTLVTKASFVSDTLQTCRLVYSLAGNGRSDEADTAKFEVFNVDKEVTYSSKDRTLGRSASWTTFNDVFEVPAGEAFRIRVTEYDRPTKADDSVIHSDNYGLLLDDLTLQCRPKHESCALKRDTYTAFTFEVAFCFNNNNMQNVLQRINEFTQKIYYSYKQTSTVHFIVPQSCDACTKLPSALTLLESEDGPIPTFTCSDEENLLDDPNQQTIVTKRTFGLCNSDATCSQLSTAHAKDDGSVTYTQIDIRKTSDIGTDANPFKKLQTADFVRPYLCPHIENAIPVSFYDKCSNSMECRCQCPLNYEVKIQGGKPTCVPKVEQCNTCVWLNTCYFVEQTTYQGSSCTIQTPYSTGGPSAQLVPFPNDNYVSGQANEQDTNINSNVAITSGPRIILELINPANPGTILKASTYTWRNFEANRYTLLNDFATYTHVGKYVLRLKAYDYTNDPAVCETTVSIKDSYHPQPNPNVRHDCPGLVGPGTATLNNYTPATYANGHTSAQAFLDWVSNLKNDVCGDDVGCSTHTYQGSNFGSTALATITTDDKVKTCLDITEADKTNMKTYVSTVTDTNPFTPNYCKKCCELSYTAKEKVHWWKCATNQWSTGDGEECQGADAGKCGYKGCFASNSGGDFFTFSANILQTVQDATTTLVNAHFADQGYLPASQVHRVLPCDYLNSNDINCHFPTTLGALFETHTSVQSAWTTVFSDASSYVRLRYRINKGAWKAFTSAENIDFTDLITCIDIEAYTACGFVGTSATFYVYLHPHKTLNVCYSLEQLGWSQASTGQIDSDYCNVPHADFGEFTFEFDTNKLKISSFGNYLGYDFKSVSCAVQYKLTDTTYSNAVQIIAPTPHSVLQHFGVNYVKHPTTHPVTEIKMSCNLIFHSAAGDLVTQTCSKSIVFRDCDAPNWDCPFGDCVNKCSAKRPFQQCGGNQISLSKELTTQFRSKYFGDESCCQECGDSSCQDIFDGALELKQCTAPQPKVLVFATLSETIQGHSFLVGSFLGVAATVMIVAVVAKKLQTSSASSMDYTLVHDDI